MTTVTIYSDFGAPQNKLCHCFPLFPHLFAMKWRDQMPWSLFFECWVKPAFSLSFSTFIKRVLVAFHFLPFQFSSVQFISVAQSCPTLCDPMDHSTPGLPVHHQLPEFTQTHVHWVSDAIQPSHPLSLPSPSALNFPSIRVFSKESALHITWPKYWSFSFSISPSNEYSGLISFRIDWFDLLALQGTLKSSLAPQFESINSLALSLLYGPTLTSVHDYWKNHSFWLHESWSAKWCLCFIFLFFYFLMSLLLNTLSRFVIALLPRSKHLLISRLQSLHSDFGAQENKVRHCFHCFPICLPWSDGTRCHDLCCLNVEF